MIFLEIFVPLLGLGWICSLGMALIAWIDADMRLYDTFFDVIELYENSSLNFLGALIVTTLCYIFFFPLAILYWICWFCTE